MFMWALSHKGFAYGIKDVINHLATSKWHSQTVIALVAWELLYQNTLGWVA